MHFTSFSRRSLCASKERSQVLVLYGGGRGLEFFRGEVGVRGVSKEEEEEE
jgi:hypothetical protein